MATARRMGPKGSEVWSSMLDSAEEILCEEGYGALTSRRVAERTGVKQRLVYYYFRTMDELIAETFQRLAIRERERLTDALTAPRTLRELWKVYVETSDTRLTSEFMALANRIPALREEVTAHIEACREIHVAALSRAFSKAGKEPAIPPDAAAIFATSAALAVHREAAIGITTGHSEVIAVIEKFIEQLEAES